MTRFSIISLSDEHDRSSFESTSPILDRYFREQATQDVRRLVTACYVATPLDTVLVAGFYTLAAGSVVLSDLPEAMAKKLPRYPAVPVARLGRLAVDRRFTGQQLGPALLWDAAQRALASSLAAFALPSPASSQSSHPSMPCPLVAETCITSSFGFTRRANSTHLATSKFR